jgi:hypothetical protein
LADKKNPTGAKGKSLEAEPVSRWQNACSAISHILLAVDLLAEAASF